MISRSRTCYGGAGETEEEGRFEDADAVHDVDCRIIVEGMGAFV